MPKIIIDIPLLPTGDGTN